MISLDHVWVRAIILATIATIVWLSYIVSDRGFRGPHNVVFRFLFFAYLATYFLGISLIFLLGDQALTSYFSLVVFYTSNSENIEIFMLSTIPFIVVTIISLVPNVYLRGRGNRRFRTAELLNERSPFLSTLFTIISILLIVCISLDELLLSLVSNSLSFGNVDGVSDLYSARTQIMSGLNFVQGGLLYGTLPALTVGLLQYKGANERVIFVLALHVLALTVIFNLGLYQSAPLFAAALIFGLVKILSSSESVLKLRYIISGSIVFFAYYAYGSIKSSGASLIGFGIYEILMRMPIAGPYLINMKNTYENTMGASEYFPQALGYHMFPALMMDNAHISMPQPSFLQFWYHYGVLASVLAFFFALAVLFGMLSVLLSRDICRSGFSRAIAVYSLCHLVYYLLQTSFSEMIVSSYGIFFPLLPYAIFSLFQFFLRPINSDRTEALLKQ